LDDQSIDEWPDKNPFASYDAVMKELAAVVDAYQVFLLQLTNPKA